MPLTAECIDGEMARMRMRTRGPYATTSAGPGRTAAFGAVARESVGGPDPEGQLPFTEWFRPLCPATIGYQDG